MPEQVMMRSLNALLLFILMIVPRIQPNEQTPKPPLNQHLLQSEIHFLFRMSMIEFNEIIRHNLLIEFSQ
jgi:hypothetical protein